MDRHTDTVVCVGIAWLGRRDPLEFAINNESEPAGQVPRPECGLTPSLRVFESLSLLL